MGEAVVLPDRSLHAALSIYTSPELLDGDNRYHCPRCARLVDARKQLRLHRSPPILVLQLKRFGFQSSSGGKIGRRIGYEEFLDLSPYTSGGKSERYRLYGVLVHQGASEHGGHYYCHVRAPSGVWHTFDDGSVRQVSAQRVLFDCAYLLFYQRVSPQPSAQGAAKKGNSVHSSPQVKVERQEKQGKQHASKAVGGDHREGHGTAVNQPCTVEGGEEQGGENGEEGDMGEVVHLDVEPPR